MIHLFVSYGTDALCSESLKSGAKAPRNAKGHFTNLGETLELHTT